MSLQAIILAGGFGTRLRRVIGDMPKPMAPVAGKPFLEHVLSELERQGFVNVVLAVGHRKELIREYFGHSFGRIRIDYSEETRPLGTGGAIRSALRLTAPAPCFVLNGDTWIRLDFAAMGQAHEARFADLSIAVRHVSDAGRFGALQIRRDRVVGFVEKGHAGPGFVNAGVYILAQGIFAGLALEEEFSFERDFLSQHVSALKPLAFPSAGEFFDIGVPEDYWRARTFLESNERAGYASVS
jgi:D-glycero-alpha-D-manno-heptose 1-phosphate guanylyltransferase